MTPVALVTGAGRGIGRAVAEALAASGSPVAVNYHTRNESAQAVVEGIRSAGGTAVAIAADVSDEAAVAAMVAQTEQQLGPIGVLVNNAGTFDDGLLVRMSTESWDRVMAVNLRSAFLCSRAVLRNMLKAKWGRIISVTSVSGIAGNAGQTNYAAAKAGLVGFTRSLAKEVGSRGITVNAIAPGFIETELIADIGATHRQAAMAGIGLGRFGTPAEVASVVRFLASEEASYIHGHVLVVDGGLVM